MKIFTNRKYQEELEKVKKPLENRILELRNKIDSKEYNFLEENSRLQNNIQKYNEIIVTQDNEIQKLFKQVKELKQKVKEINGAKGGLTKYNNKLEKELAEANEKLSKRYIIREITAEKPKNMQVMKTKSGVKTSNIIKKVVEND